MGPGGGEEYLALKAERGADVDEDKGLCHGGEDLEEAMRVQVGMRGQIGPGVLCHDLGPDGQSPVGGRMRASFVSHHHCSEQTIQNKAACMKTGRRGIQAVAPITKYAFKYEISQRKSCSGLLGFAGQVTAKERRWAVSAEAYHATE